MVSWSEAFAAQAGADLDAYGFLVKSTLPSSQRVHFLQMWLEKLCKAYVYNTNEAALQDTHNLVAKILPRLIQEHWRRIGYDNPPRAAEIKQLCKEIDLLHPQVKDGGRRPDNVEYPWMGNRGNIEVPARWKFGLSTRLESNPGRLLVKAANVLTRNPAIFIK